MCYIELVLFQDLTMGKLSYIDFFKNVGEIIVNVNIARSTFTLIIILWVRIRITF